VISNKKKKNYDNFILEILKKFHEEIKKQIKLTWDSLFDRIKGIDILNILKKLS
jgi:DNA-binding protein